ncbi:MAG: hypothetical protein ACLR23_16120 [Clostridia bacterium]
MLDPDFTIHPSEGMGAAVDIGTTTVAAYLYDLSTGALLNQASALNPQSAFGADVITRIQYTTENEDGLCRMQRAIAHQIDDLLASMTSAPIQKVCIAGNTTMLHLLPECQSPPWLWRPLPLFFGSSPFYSQRLAHEAP